MGHAFSFAGGDTSRWSFSQAGEKVRVDMLSEYPN